jgi:dissimilatory sulfite reductase related protein
MNADARKPEAGGGAPPASGPHARVIADREVTFDRDEFLTDFAEWSEELFDFLARECGLLKVDDRHRRVIRFLRDYYSANGRAPLNRQLTKGTGMSLMELEALFPDGIKYGARRLAGLPNPAGC